MTRIEIPSLFKAMRCSHTGRHHRGTAIGEFGITRIGGVPIGERTVTQLDFDDCRLAWIERDLRDRYDDRRDQEDEHKAGQRMT